MRFSPSATSAGGSDKEEQQANFTALEGTVRVKKHNRNTWTDATFNIPLEKGDVVQTGADGIAISLVAGGEEMGYLRDIEKLIRIALPREDRRTPGHREAAPAASAHHGARSTPRVHGTRTNDSAPGSKGPRRRRRGGGNNGVPQTNRHEGNRHEPMRSSSSSQGGKADSMQGVAFLHRESRPNTRPNRTQRPR